MKLRAIVTVDYEPNPKYYDTDDPHEMARIDCENWQESPMDFFASFTDDEFKIVVAPGRLLPRLRRHRQRRRVRPDDEETE